jgi:hypothetical protein
LRRASLRAPQCARKKNKQGLRGPFLSTRPVHYLAASLHNLSAPLTSVDNRSFDLFRAFVGGFVPCERSNSPSNDEPVEIEPLVPNLAYPTHLSSTLRILSGEAEGFGESIPKFDGNFHAVWALPGH